MAFNWTDEIFERLRKLNFNKLTRETDTMDYYPEIHQREIDRANARIRRATFTAPTMRPSYEGKGFNADERAPRTPRLMQRPGDTPYPTGEERMQQMTEKLLTINDKAIGFPYGVWDNDGYWKYNPHLVMSAEEQYEHNKSMGIKMKLRRMPLREELEAYKKQNDPVQDSIEAVNKGLTKAFASHRRELERRHFENHKRYIGPFSKAMSDLMYELPMGALSDETMTKFRQFMYSLSEDAAKFYKDEK